MAIDRGRGDLSAYAHTTVGALLSVVLGTSPTFQPKTMDGLVVVFVYTTIVIIAYANMHYTCMGARKRDVTKILASAVVSVVFAVLFIVYAWCHNDISAAMSFQQAIEKARYDLCFSVLMLVAHVSLSAIGYIEGEL